MSKPVCEFPEAMKDASEILYGMGVKEAALLKTVLASLKATRHIGTKLTEAGKVKTITHPDFKERREAAKDLLSILSIYFPTKTDISGQLEHTHKIMSDEEARARLAEIRRQAGQEAALITRGLVDREDISL